MSRHATCNETLTEMPDGSFYCPRCLVQVYGNVVAPPDTLEIGGGATTFLKPQRAADFIAEADDTEDEYLLAGYIPAGSVTLLVSHPKTGKSRFARQLCREMERGGTICGKNVAQGRALYLALEERPADVRKHLRLLGAEETLVLARPLRMDEKTVALLTQWIRENDLKLIVIDTINRFWRLESASDRRQVDASLSPLVDIAHTMDVTTLILHHLRKSAAGEEGTDIAESNDILAISDQAMWLRRDKKHPNRRLLQAPGIGRYPAQPDLALEFNEHGIYVGLGEAEAVAADEESADLLVAASEWLTVKELAQATSLGDATVRRRIPPLLHEGRLESVGSGKAHDPIRYRNVVAPPPNPRGETTAKTFSDNGTKPFGPLALFGIEEPGLRVTTEGGDG